MIANRAVHIVYAADDRFAEILGVSLVSLLDNNQDVQDMHIYILDNDIKKINKCKLLQITNNYHRHLHFISATNINQELSMNVKTDRGSLSQYSRLFISKNLPSEVERVLYLDCDIIVNGSIIELWNLDMHGKTIAALKDAFSKQYRKNIGLAEHDVMFNSGVMLIDLKQWEERKIEKKLLKFIKIHNGVIQQGDQGALNAILSKDTYCFHPKFNSVTIFYDFTYQEILTYRKPVDFYTEQEVNEAKKNPVIIHFTTSFLSVRPWIKGCEHPCVSLWLKYKEKSPWAEQPLWEMPKQKGLKEVYTKISKALPRKLCIAVSSVLQVYGRPFLYGMKR